MRRDFVCRWPVLLFLMLPCAAWAAEEQRITDLKQDTQGNLMLADTGYTLMNWAFIVETYMASEREGKSPPGGFRTWNERWLWHFDILRKHQENPEKYIDYVVYWRRIFGLPELEGYSPGAHTSWRFEAIYPDDEQRFKQWSRGMDQLVNVERQSDPNSLALPTWEDKWIVNCRIVYKYQENPGRYLEYIINARRAAGLPELVRRCIPEPVQEAR